MHVLRWDVGVKIPLRWSDVQKIACALEDAHPHADNVNLRYTDLRAWVVALPGFVDNPEGCNERILEAIQMAWIAERQ